ncbi:hypothetical protein F5Y14DRAFT_297904 [Nemania sp. NC0429]|nr:hypothetical protein F5Y14DRAFT_297904 [Nemania sp. NC0429]
MGMARLAPAVRAAGHRHGRMFLGEFDQPSPWRGQPNPDVDEAWEKISHASVISVTKEELERLGKFHNSSVMLPPETGGGYMASMESTHQMHCLNLLRMYSYREYYAHKLSHFADASKLRDHVDHCLEMLRQVIMCSTDLHIVTYDWVDHVDYPWPDFSVARQCRRWDNMMDWVRDRAAHSNQRQGLLIRPEGAATKPIHPVEYVHVDWEEPKQG